MILVSSVLIVFMVKPVGRHLEMPLKYVKKVENDTCNRLILPVIFDENTANAEQMQESKIRI